MILSEVKCLQSQFFCSRLLKYRGAAAICKHEDSRSLAARELWHIGDADEVIVDDQEEEEEKSDAGGDLDVVARERI